MYFVIYGVSIYVYGTLCHDINVFRYMQVSLYL